MKKILLVATMILVGVGSAAAREHHPHFWHGPAPVRAEREPVRHLALEAFWGGLAGSAIGSYIVTGQYRPVPVSDVSCVVLRSRTNGSIVKKCVSADSVRTWTWQDVYDVLYVE